MPALALRVRSSAAGSAERVLVLRHGADEIPFALELESRIAPFSKLIVDNGRRRRSAAPNGAGESVAASYIVGQAPSDGRRPEKVARTWTECCFCRVRGPADVAHHQRVTDEHEPRLVRSRSSVTRRQDAR